MAQEGVLVSAGSRECTSIKCSCELLLLSRTHSLSLTVFIICGMWHKKLKHGFRNALSSLVSQGSKNSGFDSCKNDIKFCVSQRHRSLGLAFMFVEIAPFTLWQRPEVGGFQALRNNLFSAQWSKPKICRIDCHDHWNKFVKVLVWIDAQKTYQPRVTDKTLVARLGSASATIVLRTWPFHTADT